MVSQGSPSLLGCADAFELAWKSLVPTIKQRDKASIEDSEDIASETIGKLTIEVFAHWRLAQEISDFDASSEALEHRNAATCVGRNGTAFYVAVRSTTVRDGRWRVRRVTDEGGGQGLSLIHI